jgi:hypothetical protein
MKALARLLSVVLHPLFMPLYTVALAMWLDPRLFFFVPTEARWVLLAMVAVMTVAFPLTSALLLLRAEMIGSLEMATREERIAPFVMGVLYYGMTYYLLRRSPLHPAVLSVLLGMIVAALLTTLITIRWKISAHMVGIGSMLGALWGLAMLHAVHMLPLLALAVLLAGLLGTARLLVGTHLPAQVYAGAGLGFLATYVCVVLELVI